MASLQDVAVGSKIEFTYYPDYFEGIISEIIPLEDGNKKYIVGEPIRLSDGETFNRLALYDGDEEQWEISLVLQNE